MKKLTIIIITTFILGSNSFSQSFAPIDATWHYSYYYLPAITDGYYKITSMGDTIINNKSCRKLLKENIGYNHMQQTYYNYSEGLEFVYSDSNKVYWYHNNQFNILYDFNAIAGDYWHVPNYDINGQGIGKIMVDSIGQTIINSDTLRVIYQHTDSGNVSFCDFPIIEKIGCTAFMFPSYTGMIGPEFPGPIRCYTDNQFGLHQFPGIATCDYILFTDIKSDFNTTFDVYPNPSNNKFYIEFHSDKNDKL